MRTKVLVCCRRMINQQGGMWFEATIPSWGEKPIVFPVNSVPANVLKNASNFPDNQKRFFAYIDSDAKTSDQLNIGNFEDLSLHEIFKKEEPKMYRPYFPLLLEEWEKGQEDKVAQELMGMAKHNLAVFCTDIYNTTENEEDAKKKLSRLSAKIMHLEKEVPNTTRAQALLDLLSRWDDGSSVEMEKWEKVAEELVDKFRYELVIFCSNIYQTRRRIDALFQSGVLAGAVSRFGDTTK